MLSDLWDSKLRTTLVVASIAVGVFAIGMIATAYAVLAEDINLSYAAVNPVNIEIATDPFNEEFLRAFERIPGIADVEGRRTISVRTSLDGVDWQSQNLTAVEDFKTMKINQLGSIEGTQYPNRDEMVISKDFMNDTGYHVGDQILVKFPDGETQSVTLVGLVADQARGMDAALGGSAYVTLDTLEHFGELDYYNQLYVTIRGDGGDEKEIADLAAVIKDKVERNDYNVYRVETKVSNQHPMVTMLLAIFGVLGALGVLITILSSTLIINTLNALTHPAYAPDWCYEISGRAQLPDPGHVPALDLCLWRDRIDHFRSQRRNCRVCLRQLYRLYDERAITRVQDYPICHHSPGLDRLSHPPGGRLLSYSQRVKNKRAPGDQQ